MIQREFNKAWSVEYPWRLPEMVEQDLIICRAIVSIFSDPFLARELAWKGGTALVDDNKLYGQLANGIVSLVEYWHEPI